MDFGTARDGKVIADGEPRAQITPENLHRLYRVHVDSVTGPAGRFACAAGFEYAWAMR